MNRGDLYMVDWSPGRGREQTGARPALIIQNDIGNLYSSTTIVAAVTTTIKGSYPFQVIVEPEDSGLPQRSTIKLDQILTVDKERLLNKIGHLSPPMMLKVDQAIRHSLGL